MEARKVVAGICLWGAAALMFLLGCSQKGPALSPTVAIEPSNFVSGSSSILQEKCTRCHDLGRVYAVVGSGGDWVKTVVVMSSKERGWISAHEMEHLATCTFNAPEATKGGKGKTPPESLLPPRVVLEEKCSHCHELGRVYAAIDDPLQWVKIVVKMSDKDRDWLSGEAVRAVIRYRQRHPQYVQQLFDDTCGACHRWDELRSMEKTVSQWRTTIKYMAGRCNEGMQNDELDAIYYALAVQ